jgi:hypothetical protein
MSDGFSRRFGRIPEATRRTGVRRSKMYGLAAQYPGLFKKLDDVTIVDFQMLDEILADLPAADIGKREPASETAR